MHSILFVEDDGALAFEVTAFLEDGGYSVVRAGTGAEARKLMKVRRFDLCLLDVGLPDCSGFDLCRRIRGSYAGPVIMLTAYDREDDVVDGLQSGADDYVTKPFSFRILQSRISAQLRRAQLPRREERRVRSGELFIDFEHRMICRGEMEIPLGETEFKLCEALIKNDGKIMPRQMLLDRIWDQRERYIEDNTLSVHVSRLRKKLGRYEGRPYIDTVKGIGYRWNHDVRRNGEEDE